MFPPLNEIDVPWEQDWKKPELPGAVFSLDARQVQAPQRCLAGAE
jgi:hypothetical protein